MGGEGHVLKRIPRIKFPQRNLNSSSSSEKGRNSDHVASASAPPQKNTATAEGGVGGKASLQPKRTPVSDKEIEAVLLGGCF